MKYKCTCSVYLRKYGMLQSINYAAQATCMNNIVYVHNAKCFETTKLKYTHEFSFQWVLRLRDTMRGVVSHELRPAVAPAPLVSLSWKQLSMKLVTLASIAREERPTACVDAYLRRLPQRKFSRQKSDLAWEIQHRRLQSRYPVTTSSKWRKLSHLAFSVREKGGN